jgi:hypothetical protein
MVSANIKGVSTMKKFNILNQPARVQDLKFDDDNDIYDDSSLRLERIEAKQLRKFKHQLA